MHRAPAPRSDAGCGSRLGPPARIVARWPADLRRFCDWEEQSQPFRVRPACRGELELPRTPRPCPPEPSLAAPRCDSVIPTTSPACGRGSGSSPLTERPGHRLGPRGDPRASSRESPGAWRHGEGLATRPRPSTRGARRFRQTAGFLGHHDRKTSAEAERMVLAECGAGRNADDGQPAEGGGKCDGPSPSHGRPRRRRQPHHSPLRARDPGLPWSSGLRSRSARGRRLLSMFAEDLWRGLGALRLQSTMRAYAYALARNASHRFLARESAQTARGIALTRRSAWPSWWPRREPKRQPGLPQTANNVWRSCVSA